jgi:hypothetical protein
MERQRQFSLRHLFIELTLIAVLLAAIRLIFVLGFGSYKGRYEFVVLLALCAAPILFGTVIGGLFGRFVSGALWGAVGMMGLIVLVGLFYAATHH